MKSISEPALSVINSYAHFRFGAGECSIPYYNNKVNRVRGALAVSIGKGSIEDITDEVASLTKLNKLYDENITNESLKKVLVDYNVGIDCSGYAFYVLNAEVLARTKKPLAKVLHFNKSTGLMGWARRTFRPVENCDVATLSDNSNSSIVSISQIQPGDMICMIRNSGPSVNPADRDHILLIKDVEYNESQIPISLTYTHASMDPEDGIYGNGIKFGTIKIIDTNKYLIEQEWLPESTSPIQRTLERAQKSVTEIRRLRVLIN